MIQMTVLARCNAQIFSMPDIELAELMLCANCNYAEHH
jgi:hypothetical protein